MKDLILACQDLRYLEWSRIRRSSGTAGSFLKAYRNVNGAKQYYKLSNYNAYDGIVGHECVNELTADRLLSVLGIDHLHYQLVHGIVSVDGREYDTFLCRSNDFRKADESKTALDVYYQLERYEEESPLDFCSRMGWTAYIYQMLLVDFLICNRDRHGANMEVLRSRSARSVRLAPLFDHGLSMFFQCRTDEELEQEDAMADKRVQSFVGTDSLFENLKIIPPDKMPRVNPLRETDRFRIFEGLDHVISGRHIEKLWEMIWRRWLYYEDFCNQR